MVEGGLQFRPGQDCPRRSFDFLIRRLKYLFVSVEGFLIEFLAGCKCGESNLYIFMSFSLIPESRISRPGFADAQIPAKSLERIQLPAANQDATPPLCAPAQWHSPAPQGTTK